MTTEKWTVETLARYLWERVETSTCDDCRVEKFCRIHHEYECHDLWDILTCFGLKEQPE